MGAADSCGFAQVVSNVKNVDHVKNTLLLPTFYTVHSLTADFVSYTSLTVC